MNSSREILGLDTLPLNETVTISDDRAVVIRTVDGVTGFVNRCLHQDLPLTGAHIADGVLICPHHFWRYQIPDGRLCSQPANERCLTVLPVTVAGNEVTVELPGANAPSESLRDQLIARAQSWNRDDPPDPNHPGARHD